MSNSQTELELIEKSSKLASVFDEGFENIIKKPEFKEYFYNITPEQNTALRKEVLAFVTYAVSILLRTNGHLHDPEKVQTFMEGFIERCSCWDDSLYSRIDEYRALDSNRGDALSSASSVRFAKYAAGALFGNEFDEGALVLGLTDFATLFIINFITPTLAESFYQSGERGAQEDLH